MKSEERQDDEKDDGNHGQPYPWRQEFQEENNRSAQAAPVRSRSEQTPHFPCVFGLNT